jgi:hypothetical protein
MPEGCQAARLQMGGHSRGLNCPYCLQFQALTLLRKVRGRSSQG